jgi:hypothetical protein
MRKVISDFREAGRLANLEPDLLPRMMHWADACYADLQKSSVWTIIYWTAFGVCAVIRLIRLKYFSAIQITHSKNNLRSLPFFDRLTLSSNPLSRSSRHV